MVTGAGQGIGRDIVKALVKCDATVVAVSRTKSSLESLQKECPSIETICVDLSKWNDVKIALSEIGDIDLLVNNAGLAILEPLEDVTEEHINQSFDINVKALIQLSQLVAKNLTARNKPGSIVNLSSQASKAGLQDHTVYCATKGAVDAFTRAAALELGPRRIRVNCVNPTVILTAMGKLGWSDPAKAEPMLQKIPLRRFGEVHEVVDAVLFLLSDKASMITGTCLDVDGGYLAV